MESAGLRLLISVDPGIGPNNCSGSGLTSGCLLGNHKTLPRVPRPEPPPRAGGYPNNCYEGPGSQHGLLPRQLGPLQLRTIVLRAAGEEGQPKLPHRHFRFAVEIYSGKFVTHRFTFCSFEVN